MATNCPDYVPLALQDRDELVDNDKEDTAFITKNTTCHTDRRIQKYKFAFITTLIFALILFVTTTGLILRILRLRRVFVELSTGFPTDFQDARKTIAYEQTKFTGDIKLNRTSREVFHSIPEGGLRYFGDPEIYPEIDRNWKDLLKYEFFSLTDKEAEPFDAYDFVRMPDHSYHASLAVLHGLHCLNAIRIHIDKDFYLKNGDLHQDGPGYPANFGRTHISHCLDQVRQMIQCQGDLAPVPVHLEKEIRIDNKPMYIATGATHTCKKFDNILDWLKKREEKYGSYGEFEYKKPQQSSHA